MTTAPRTTAPATNVPRLAIIIPTFKRDDLLESCLEHLERQTFKSFEVLVLDNEERTSPPQLLERFPGVKWIPLFKNRGTAAAFNRGLAECRSREYVLLLNNDAELEPDCLARLVGALDSKTGFSVAVPKLLQQADPALLDGAGDELLLGGGAYRVGHGERDAGQYDEPESVLSACAAAALYRRALFDDVGDFDEDFFAYRDDVDLGLRAQLRGHRCRLVPQARARHLGSATLGATLHPEIIRLSTRNQIFLLVKNYPAALLIRLAPQWLVFQLLWLGLALRTRTFIPCCLGILEALARLPRMLRKRRTIQRSRRLSSGDLLARLRESEQRIWRWCASPHSPRPSRLLRTYFWLLGKPASAQPRS